MVEFPIPTGPISTALWIAQAPDGDIWFTEWSANNIGVLHVGPIVPFSLAVSEVSLSLAAGEETTLTISKATSGVAGNGTFTYSWSSYLPSEVGVTFSPNPYPSLEGQSKLWQAEVKVSNKVNPGNYTLAIGVDVGAVRVSSMVQVDVTPANSVPGPVFGYPTLLVLAPLLVVAIAAWFLRKRFSRTQLGEIRND
jgi:hypothetical protein